MSEFYFYKNIRSFFNLTRPEYRTLVKAMKTWSWFDKKKFIDTYVGEKLTIDDLDHMISDDKKKFDDIDERTFLKFCFAENSTWRYENFRPDKAYSLEEATMNIDPWVSYIMKETEPEMYREIYGQTKIGRLTRAFQTLAKFGLPLKSDHNIRNDEKMLSIYADNFRRMENLLLKNNGYKKYETISADNAIKSIPTNTSAGFTYQGKTKGEVSNLALSKSKAMLSAIKNNQKVHFVPCTLAVRGHLSNILENKSRPIWVLPYETVVIEATLFTTIYQQLKKADSCVPFLTGKQSLQRFWNYMNTNYATMVSVDISQWDLMRADWLIDDAFDMFAKIINLKQDEEKVLNWVRLDLKQTRLCLPSGIIISKRSGIPSGTYLTLLINSVINYVVQRSTLTYLQIRFENQSVLGDDNAFFTDIWTETKKQKLSETQMDFFGMLVHPKKMETYDSVYGRKFLGYEIRNMTLYRSDKEWFSHVLYPEREIKSLLVSFSRVFSYLLIGGINSSRYFNFFSKFFGTFYDLMKGQKFDTSIFRVGQLRIFKFILDISPEEFSKFSVDSFLNLEYFLIPYFLTLGYDIKQVLNVNH